jgi:hypothetical protein
VTQASGLRVAEEALFLHWQGGLQKVGLQQSQLQPKKLQLQSELGKRMQLQMPTQLVWHGAMQIASALAVQIMKMETASKPARPRRVINPSFPKSTCDRIMLLPLGDCQEGKRYL